MTLAVPVGSATLRLSHFQLNYQYYVFVVFFSFKETISHRPVCFFQPFKGSRFPLQIRFKLSLEDHDGHSGSLPSAALLKCNLSRFDTTLIVTSTLKEASPA